MIIVLVTLSNRLRQRDNVLNLRRLRGLGNHRRGREEIRPSMSRNVPDRPIDPADLGRLLRSSRSIGLS